MPESVFYSHYSLVPPEVWRWPNFKPYEIASKGDGSILIHFDSLDKLQAARTLAKRPFIIDSAYRDPIHNTRIGGASDSMHMKGRAFDVNLSGFSKHELYKILIDAGFSGFGLHYVSFIHADTGRPRTW